MYGPIIVVPQILSARFDKTVGEGLDLGLGRHGGVGWALELGWEARNVSPDLGAETGLVELLLLVEKAFFLVTGFLLVEALPLPLVEPAREGSWAATHGPGPEEREWWTASEDSGCFAKDEGGYHGVSELELWK